MQIYHEYEALKHLQKVDWVNYPYNKYVKYRNALILPFIDKMFSCKEFITFFVHLSDISNSAYEKLFSDNQLVFLNVLETEMMFFRIILILMIMF